MSKQVAIVLVRTECLQSIEQDETFGSALVDRIRRVQTNQACGANVDMDVPAGTDCDAASVVYLFDADEDVVRLDVNNYGADLV